MAPLFTLSVLGLSLPARAQSTCTDVPVDSVIASADDGNGAGNVLDGSTSSRWSCDGSGCWIRADLGSSQQVSAVDITWYRGDERNSNYEVALSNDGSSWSLVAAGLSTRTLEAQRVAFTLATARYVRITVKGNTMNNWASISELRVLNCGTTSTPTPEPTPTPGTDVFGVTMIYPSKVGGEAWAMGADPTRDSRFKPQNTITRNADGSWKIKSTQVRMSVFTSTGHDSTKIASYDPDVMAGKGYMQAPNDWKNIEMTGFVKLNAATDMSDNFDWYARGGRHTDSLACEGTSYKGALHYDGRTRWQKESWHVSYDQASYKPATTSLKGRWVGFKAVMRNVLVNGAEAVRLELYLNNNADKVTWTKIYDMVDSGSWGGDTTHCGGSRDGMPFTWGGPIAVFRWDNASDVDFKWLSVREIQP